VAAGFARLKERAPALDLLVNNAGVGGGQPVEGSDEEGWRRIIDTNVTGTLPRVPRSAAAPGDGRARD
jgi:NAD(P)-dependent dehydrogenase (short-subunit alcohol dehydrogenase family)